MTNQDLSRAILDDKQWTFVEQLARSVSPLQAHWLGGYFSGLGASAPPLVESPVPGPSIRRLAILFGTETGNAADVARSLETRAREKGLAPILAEMANYKIRQLSDEQDLLIVVSTYGEGDPPQPATGFFEFLEGRRAPKLGGIRYAVLALGDSSYEFYCEAGKRIDRRLEELGAERLAPRVDCDIDFEAAADAWVGALIGQLSVAAVPGAPTSISLLGGVPARDLRIHDKRNPFPAAVLENTPIVGRGSTKETRHIEFSLEGSGLTYTPGDALGIDASNDPSIVTGLLELLSIPDDAVIDVKGQTLTMVEALTHRFEITAATPRFLDYWSLLSDAAELKQLQQADRAGERTIFLRTHHIIDIVRRFPVGAVLPTGFITGLRPLQPRLYSIASSLAAAPDEAHVTVAPVRYALHGAARSGVASGHLADRAEIEAALPVYIQANSHFRLPDDDVPVIMIGAGTGVAPYRAFLQEREVRGAQGKNWLFFGERNFRTDFLYQTEWQAWLRDGMLSRMDVAFSRDGVEKIYVQRRMMERARDLFAWLEDGAHIYVCGDAAHLAPDVHAALIDLVAAEARSSRGAAEDYVRSLQTDQRYQRDVY